MYDPSPLTDEERQFLTFARIELKNFSRKHINHNFSEDTVDRIQELMMREWLFKDKEPRKPRPEYKPPKWKEFNPPDFKGIKNAR